jgi:cobalamin biosynthesis Mg chelatase CobN
MLRRSLAVLLLAGTVSLGFALGASVLRAQSVPAGTQAKRAARNAAAKTDAHTRAMQEPTATSERPAKGAPARSATGQASSSQVTQQSSSAPQAAQSEARNGDDASVSVRGGKDEVGFRREAFSYERSGRRDPFLSLLHSHDLRPMINDLKLVAVLYDPVGRSWAVMRDMTTKEQYRVKVGQQLGRMRVTQIHPKSVTFTIEEIGFSRQQTLALNDSKEREP